MKITDTQLHRYARQIVMHEIDEDGQQALLSSKVAVLGAGGLGSVVIANLAAAGVGELIICDNDIIDLSNLNRQIIYRERDVGKPKTESAKRFVQDINPDVSVKIIQETMEKETLNDILSDCNLLVDCADQFSTRFDAAKAAFQNGIPHIFGGAVRFDGQMASFTAGVEGYNNSPCFACLFPKDSGAAQTANCAQAGILSPITGLIANLQSLETIKWITRAGEMTINKLILFDGFSSNFKSIETTKLDNCVICSKNDDLK